MYLEVISLSVEDTIKINESAASRIELCSHLEFGGYTPDYQVIKEACEVSKIPVNVMVRRKHADFYINSSEAEQLFADIDFIKTTKANGIVIGAITNDNKIDVDFLTAVIKRAGDKKIIFHRAFDAVENKVEAYQLLNDLKIDTILTSGAPNINDGYEILQTLVDQNLATTILIGGGVSQANIAKVKSISNYIHVGTAARVDGTFASAIDIEKINSLVNI